MIDTRADELRYMMENVALGYFSRYLSFSFPITILITTYTYLLYGEESFLRS